MYAHLILYLGLNPEYVNKMEMYEISALMKYAHKKHQAEYECARLGAYMTAQTHTTKHLKFTDIVKFGWEEEADNQNRKPLKRKRNSDSVSDIQRLRNEASEFLKTYKIPDAPMI